VFVRHARRHVVAVAVSIWCATVAVGATDKPLKAFEKDWEGRRVVVRRSLYSLVFDEASRLGGLKPHRKAEGLTVATPSSETYYLFPGRRGQAEIVDRDPNRLLDQVRRRYERGVYLDIGTVSTVAPIMVTYYPAGAELVVRDVTVDRDRVRLVLHNAQPGTPENVPTSLTIQWPTLLSSGFTERAKIEALILEFIDVVAST
jgi:hypothetical protein